MGAATAYSLAKRGVSVALLEQFEFGHTFGRYIFIKWLQLISVLIIFVNSSHGDGRIYRGI